MKERPLPDFDPATLPVDGFDFVIVGSGVAGLWCALDAAERGSVAIVTKARLEEGSTLYAQGGIAAALCPQDSPASHLQDTLEAGVGLVDRRAASVLVTEGPRRVRELVARGAQFDSDEHGELLLAREGAHGVHRIVRAHGDATGRELQRALTAEVRSAPVSIFEDTFTVDLLTVGDECVGLVAWDAKAQQLRLLRAKATILCTGGLGQLYRVTTNPPVVTGDGMAMAYRAGASLMDMEFVQFHPTALASSRSPKFLISEAARGEGALLRNQNGERFMPRYHERAELAPRDVVSRAIVAEMRRLKTDHVWLDLTAHDRDKIRQRFPCIYQTCVEEGIEPSTQPIPVSPAAHYMMGGIRTDIDGQTTLAGLFACGECACAGVHGANRLASNSLLEGLVFGSRTVRAAARRIRRQTGTEPVPLTPGPSPACEAFAPAECRGRERGAGVRGSDSVKSSDTRHSGRHDRPSLDTRSARELLRELMWERVGILRSARGLMEARRALEELQRVLLPPPARREEMELANMVTLAHLMTQSALLREESRGAHWREDFPARDDANWKKHLVLSRVEDEPRARVSFVASKS